MTGVKRNEKGQLVKGTAALSPGRPKRVVEVEFHNILLDNISPEIWTGIVKRAVMDALKGDRYARQFIAEYTLGRPPQILELRAAEAALLKELLQRFEAENVPASDVFNAMLATFVDENEAAG